MLQRWIKQFRAVGTLFALTAVLACADAVWAQVVPNPTIQSPRRIAEGPGNHLLVTDRSGMIVAVRKDNLAAVWGFRLPLDGAPFGLASLRRFVFVGNTETKNVEVYQIKRSGSSSVTLVFRYNLGQVAPGEAGSVGNPIGVAVDRLEQLVFVLDGHAKKVKIFGSKGALLGAFEPRDGAGVLLSPVSVAVDEMRKEVLVGDYGDPSGSAMAAKPARILIYDYQGNLLDQINGSDGFGGDFMFARVQGLATSPDGRIFATDPLGGRVLVLDRTSGTLLEVLGTQGPDPQQLMLPTDVILDGRTGDLFVVNNQGARSVEVFRGAGG